MPTWNELNAGIRALGTIFDIVRRKYLRQLAGRTGRNTVLLYSGWLDRPKHPGTSINDVDKIGLMTVAGGLDPGRGLDLVIHTLGGIRPRPGRSLTPCGRSSAPISGRDRATTHALGRHDPLLHGV